MLNRLIKYLPKSFSNFSVEEQRKWTIVFSTNLVTIGIQCFYLYRFMFDYKILWASTFSIVCMAFNLMAFYYFFKQKYIRAAVSVLIPGTADLIFLIFLAGGIEAPGTFWLAILPFFYGMFFGRNGSIVGGQSKSSKYFNFF